MQLISTSLKEWSSVHPHLMHLFLPLSMWLENIVWPNHIAESSSSDSSLDECVDSFINALLIDVQSILKLSNPQPHLEADEVVNMEQEEKPKDDFIKNGLHLVENVSKSLHIDAILTQLDKILVKAATSPADVVKDAVSRFLPFLDRYTALVDEQLSNHSRWNGAIFKLNYVLCSVIQTLAKDGFCKPPDVETEGEGEAAAESNDGVGLGEGSGKENVSKEIEDESQVEGLQDEGAEKNEERNKDEGDDNAIEMTEDFGGDLEDLDEKEEQDREQSDGESEEDPEEQIGELENDDPAALDEKLWGDEAGPQDDKSSDDKTNQDHSKEDDKPSDIVAKEQAQKNKGDDKAGEKGDEKEQAEEQAEDGEQEMPQEDQEAKDPNASGAPMEEHIDEANTLDLPEDLNLGEDSEMQGPQDPELDDDELSDNAGSDVADDLGDEPEVDINDDAPDVNKADEDAEMDVDDDEMRKGHEDDKDERAAEEDQEDKPPAMQPDLHSGDGKGDGLPEAGASGTLTEPEQGDAGVQGQGEQSGEQDIQTEAVAESCVHLLHSRIRQLSKTITVNSLTFKIPQPHKARIAKARLCRRWGKTALLQLQHSCQTILCAALEIL